MNKNFEEDLRVTLGQSTIEQKSALLEDKDKLVINENEMSYFCLSPKDGQVIWQTISESNLYVDTNDKINEIDEYKYARIEGRRGNKLDEISWEDFHDALFQNMPHSWNSYFDTKIKIGHFSRDMTNNPTKYKFIGIKLFIQRT